jgi:hypothetical protein
MVDDVIFDNGEIPYLHIAKNEGRRIKNAQSQRNIPLHPEVIRLNFLTYVKAIKALGYKLLFPDLFSPTSSSPLGDRFYKHVSANIGYKFDLPNKYYIEPTACIEYVRSNFSGTTAFSPTTIALHDGDATRGRIGARVGTEFLVNGIRIEPSLLGYVYSIFSQTDNALVFNSAGITLPSDVGKVRGEIQAAVNFFNLTNGMSGFVRADTRFGDDLTAVGVRVGVRYQM